MTPRPTPPVCINRKGVTIYRHRFPSGTSRPNSTGARRQCRNCGLAMLAYSTPPRAKQPYIWHWPLSAVLGTQDRTRREE